MSSQSPLHVAGALLVHFKWDLNRVVEEFTKDPSGVLERAGFPAGTDPGECAHMYVCGESVLPVQRGGCCVPRGLCRVGG